MKRTSCTAAADASRHAGIADRTLRTISGILSHIISPHSRLSRVCRTAARALANPTSRTSAMPPIQTHSQRGKAHSGSSLTDETIDHLNAQCESEETPAGHALSNIHRRLTIHYGDPACGLSFTRSPLGGLRVCLTVKDKEGA